MFHKQVKEPDNLIIYNTKNGKSQVALYIPDSDIWMIQNQLAEFFATSMLNITIHIKNIISDNELSKDSVIKDYLITAADGKSYQVKHYALPMILAIGFRVCRPCGVQFRRWTNTHLQTYLHKGLIMNNECLKNPDGSPNYFDEMLTRIRDIRASEKRFYQKVRDLLKLSKRLRQQR